MIRKKIFSYLMIMSIIFSFLFSCAKKIDLDETLFTYDKPLENLVVEMNMQYELINDEEVKVLEEFEFATYSQIKTGTATLYKNESYNKKNKTICINAGHGTKGGSRIKTYSHPDKSPKLVTGSTSAGSIMSSAITDGMVFSNGQNEADVNLEVAKLLKDMLLSSGFSVLMIRESSDTQLDNIARTILANEYADIHLSIHFDSDNTDKGFFYITVPNVESFKKMYPVNLHYEESDRLGECMIEGFRENNEKVFKSGKMAIDLTQSSYSKIPTIDMELGAKNTDIDHEHLYKFAESIFVGICKYYDIPYEIT